MAGKRNFDPVAEFFALAAALGDLGRGAVTDIRQKVVEEPWFGRTVTPERHVSMAEKLGWSSPSEEQKAKAWDALCDSLAREQGQKSGREHAPEHDHGRDDR